MILKGLECSNCDETFEWVSEATLHVCKEKTKYTCDFICACPANDTAERVEKEVREKIAVAIEGLTVEDIQLFAPYKEEAISLTKLIAAKIARSVTP